MRIDKFLKVSRIIKRRSVAQEACDRGLVSLNDKTVKPSSVAKVGDTLIVKLGSNPFCAKILSVNIVGQNQMYEVIENG